MEKILRKERIVPVAVIEDERKAVEVAEALIRGGLYSIEVTFRTKQAAKAIKNIRKNVPEMIVGAGTILTIEQAEEAILAGAKFIVSPMFVPEVIAYCQKKQIPVIPGCVTPTEFMQAQKMGIYLVKFFPASQFGGLSTIKAICSVMPELSIMPTGGIHLGNLAEYLAYDKICACGGSYLVEKSLIEEGDYQTIARLALESRKIADLQGEL